MAFWLQDYYFYIFYMYICTYIEWVIYIHSSDCLWQITEKDLFGTLTNADLQSPSQVYLI